MRAYKRVLIAAVAVPALLLSAAACSDDDGNTATGDSNASQASIDEINARMQRNEMITALLGIGALPLHDIDETIAAGEEIPSNAIPSMRTVIRLTSLTNWDSDLQAAADTIHDDAEAFIGAAETDDHAVLAEKATAVHEGWHDFATDAWEVVAPGTGGTHTDEEESPHTETTPHADETPGAEATP